MADVIGAAGLTDQIEVPADLPPFAFRADARMPVRRSVRAVVNIAAVQKPVVLAMRGDQFMKPLCLPHRLAHQIVVLYASSIVGKGDHARRQILKIGKLFAPFAHADRTVGVNANARLFGNQLFLNSQMRNTVRHGVQIRHGAHGGIPASCSRCSAACNRFFIRKTRLAKMYVYIAEAG